MPCVTPTSQNSRTIETRLRELLKNTSHVCHERLYEFDAVYLLHAPGNGWFYLSFALPGLDDDWREKLLSQGAREALATKYLGCADLDPETTPGYQVTLRVNLQTLKRSSVQEHCISLLSGLGLHVVGAPLRRHLEALAGHALQEGPIEEHCAKPGQVYYVKPRTESVLVIFPIRFYSSQDAALGQVLVQSFVDAPRHTPTLGKSPSCSYHTLKIPPMELQSVSQDPSVRGYLCWTFLDRHVTGSQLDHVLWSVTTFYTLLSHQVMACKAMMHSRMRSKLDVMLQQLPPAPSEPLLVTPLLAPGSTGVTGNTDDALGAPQAAVVVTATNTPVFNAGAVQAGAVGRTPHDFKHAAVKALESDLQHWEISSTDRRTSHCAD